MTEDLLDQLAAAIARHSAKVIPLDIALWDIETVANYFQRNVNVCRERIACLPDFPAAIRLPSATGKRAHPLYSATEVIAYAEKYKERK
jgi:hypothetical protein